jgi:RNA exonuclease 4
LYQADPSTDFETVQSHIKTLLADKIVIGHALFHDLAVLQHRHVYEDMRDTALYYPLRQRCGVKGEGNYPSLQRMAKEVLGRDIQCGRHCPVSRLAAPRC